MAVSVATSKAISILSIITSLKVDERRIIHGATWQEYQELMDELGEHRRTLISFFDGVLEIMPTSHRHEHYKESIARFVWILAEELELNVEPNGSATLQLEALRSGIEPDTSFFIRHSQYMVGKETHNLLEDPPPDLAVEIDVSRPRYNKKEIYARLGVPELWQYDGHTFKILELVGDAYVEVESSATFPFIQTGDLAAFLERGKTESSFVILKSFREWVRANKPTE